MPKLFALIALCGMYISVFSDDRKKCIFDWESLETQGDADNIVVDSSELQISTLTEDSSTYHYITGTLKIKADVDSTYQTFYKIQKWSEGGVKVILIDIENACYFIETVRPEYLAPVAGSHNDFPPEFNDCPMKKGTYNILPATNSMELMAPSLLDEGKYYLTVTFVKNFKPAGGIGGNFTVLRN